MRFAYFAGGLGIEPRYAASKAAVLPLDDPPAIDTKKTILTFERTLPKTTVSPLDDPPMFENQEILNPHKDNSLGAIEEIQTLQNKLSPMYRLFSIYCAK